MRRVYFGHHKCASQYVKAVFLDATARLGMRPSHVDGLSQELPLDYHLQDVWRERLAQRRTQLLTGSAVTLCLINADAEAVGLLEERGDYRGFHVIRDPRDILVSAYFSHRYSHPRVAEEHWIAEFRRRLSTAPDVESGLLLEMEFCATYFHHLATWDYANPNIYETRFERLVADPEQEFTYIFNHLGVATPRLGLTTLAEFALHSRLWRRLGRQRRQRTTLPQPMLRRILRRHTFARLSQGRRPGEEDVRHHYRKGAPGDWRNYFSPSMTDLFKARYGALLIQLGYEADLNWS